jgi:hypothetical protein
MCLCVEKYSHVPENSECVVAAGPLGFWAAYEFLRAPRQLSRDSLTKG